MTKLFFEDKNKYNLTERELDVLKCLVQGKTNAEIAKELSITVHTVKANVGGIFHKLVVRDRVQAVVKALYEKLIDI